MLAYMVASPSVGTLILGACFIAAGVACWVASFLQTKRIADVTGTPVVPITNVSSGLVALQGRARSDNVSVAPVSGQQCVHWETSLAVPKGRAGLVTIAREAFPSDDEFTFTLEDDTGSVHVYTLGALKILDDDEEHSTADATAKTLSDSGVEWVRKQGRTWTSTGFLQTPLIVDETRIVAGAPMYVLGTASTVGALPPDQQPANLQPSDVLIWQGDPKRDFVISTRGRDQVSSSLGSGTATGTGPGFNLGLGLVLVLVGAGFLWAAFW